MVDSGSDLRSVLRLGRSRGRRASWWARIGIIVLLLGGVALGVDRFVRQRAAQIAPKYQTEKARRADVRVTVTTTGNIKGSNIVEVGAEVTGKVLRVDADYNDRVAKGRVLAEIDPEQLNAAVEETGSSAATKSTHRSS